MNSEALAVSGELAAELAKVPPVPSFLDLPHGIHPQVPDEVYHQRILGVVSKGALDKVIESAASYRAWIDSGTEETEALFFGRAGHCYLLEEEVFRARYVVEPDFGYLVKHDASGTSKEQGKENRERRDAFRAKHKGATLVTADQFAAMVGIRASLARDPDIGPYVRAIWADDGSLQTEVTLKWECPTTGLVCKARTDIFGEDEILDIKTTQNCRAEPFNRSRKEFGYHRQDAHYRAGAAAVGRPVKRFRFVAVEKTPPYLLQVYELDPELLLIGERQVEAAKLELMRCLTFDDWPGLEPGVKVLRPLPWENRS